MPGLPIQAVRAATVVELLFLVLVFAERFGSAQRSALAQLERRAQEAEDAHQESEEARHESEQRSRELQQLLDLVQSLEVPVIAVGSEVLIVPLIGHLDHPAPAGDPPQPARTAQPDPRPHGGVRRHRGTRY
jgi:hypothetical protein